MDRLVSFMDLFEECGVMDVSQHVTKLAESATLAVAAKAAAMRAEGIDVVSLAAGEPDFDTPQHIKDAAIAAINAGKTKYSKPASGVPELKDAICRKLQRENGLTYKPSQIIVTAGAKKRCAAYVYGCP